MLTLTIPPHRDPIARLALLASIAVVLYTAFTSATAPAQAQSDPPPVILIATPTLPIWQPTEAPALTLAAPTPAPQVIYVLAPTAELQVISVAAPGDVQPAYDPTLHPAEAAAAETQAFQDLPTLHCPCGTDSTEAAPTARDYAYSRARTR
jgi:hypothetical protein